MSIIGIDLGTTNTVVAAEGRVRRLRAEGSNVLPSAVAYPPSGKTLVGIAARRRRAMDPANTIFSAKRVIGQRWHSSAAKEFRRRYPFEVKEDSDGFVVFDTRAGEIRPSTISAQVVAATVVGADLEVGDCVGVIAVPSLFRDSQLEATIEAGKQAGLRDVRIIREPVATAAAYLSQTDTSVELAAVFDLGGGTFDMAVVDCTTDPFKVLSHGGDIFLGGDDVDVGLARWVAEEVLRTRGWDLQSDSNVFNRLVLFCEQSKVALSDQDQTTIDLGEVDPAAPVEDKELVIEAAIVDQLAQQLVRRTFIICDEVLMKIGKKARDLDAVFLAGGAIHLKVVREGVETYFGRPGICELDPMEVVAIGACMKGNYDDAQARLRSE